MSIDRKRSNVLLVQLADIGDLVLAAPAIQHLRNSSPDSRFTLLTKPTNVALARSLADEVLFVDKNLYDRPSGLLRASSVMNLVRLVWSVRRQRFDEVIVLHHLVTAWGTIKFALLTLSTGARRRKGLDNGRGLFLTDRINDHGFGAEPEREYWGRLAGGLDPFEPRTDSTSAATILKNEGINGPYFVVHPGVGFFQRCAALAGREVCGGHRRLGAEVGSHLCCRGRVPMRRTWELDYRHPVQGG